MAQVLTNNSDAEVANQNVVYALDGDDIVFSLQTSPVLYGGEGRDALGNNGTGVGHLYGGRGNDAIHGGTTLDHLYGDEDFDLLVGGEYNYDVAVQTGNIVPLNNELSGDDSLYGGDGIDALYGFEGNDYLDGGEGFDDKNNLILVQHPFVPGSAFAVSGGLYGGDGNDTIHGGGGNDFLDGGSGTDILKGGSDNDTYVIDTAGDSALELPGDGFDTVLTSTSYALGFGSEIESLNTNDVVATLAINLTGNAYGQTITGNAGANILSGLDGHDRMFGLGGNDRVFGGFGNDVVDGGAGGDVLLGQRGADDIYTGGADGVRDRVVYTSLAESGVNSLSRDEVFNFVRGQDKIDLRPIDANLSAAGNQKFKVVSAFTSDRGEVRLDHTAGGDTIIRIDGDRDTTVDMTIRVVGVQLSAVDLLL